MIILIEKNEHITSHRINWIFLKCSQTAWVHVWLMLKTSKFNTPVDCVYTINFTNLSLPPQSAECK